MCQLCHYLWVGTSKDFIGLCQYFHFTTLCLHSLDCSVQVIYLPMVIFCWGWRYVIDIFYRRCVLPPFLRWQLLYFVLNYTSRKSYWTRPMYWGWWFAISNIKCLCWNCLYMPQGLSFWTPSSRWKLSALLNMQIIPPFYISRLNRLCGIVTYLTVTYGEVTYDSVTYA